MFSQIILDAFVIDKRLIHIIYRLWELTFIFGFYSFDCEYLSENYVRSNENSVDRIRPHAIWVFP